jgi:hypothetical protein
MEVDPGEWTYTIEKNPAGTGFHAHALQRGSYIQQDLLQEACERARAGIPYINAIKRTGHWTSRYGLKGFGADGYGLKTFRANGQPAEALRINNGRLEHHTRAFYQIDGDVMRVRDFERLALTAMNEDSRVALVGMSADSAPSVLANDRLRHRMIISLNQRSAARLRALR